MEPFTPTMVADGPAKLLRLAEFGNELGATGLSGDARSLATRIAEGRFYAACIGQFKRGKSTLINAIVGEPILPVGFTPVTAVPTVVRYGKQRQARVQARDGSWHEVAITDLQQYVSEECNPENQKSVNGVEVLIPCPLLSTGMCLVDTPGLGSVFTGNSAVTRAFIPHIDAVVLVIGADPPLAQEELALVEAAHHVRDLVLVLNKADRTPEDEKSAAVAFARRLLEERLGREVGRVYEISATERLENSGPPRDWGMLLDALQSLVADSQAELVGAAFKRGLRRLSEQLLAIISIEREAFERPLKDSERRITTMKENIGDADRLLRELGFLFNAEQRHLSDLLGGRHQAFLARVLPEAKAEFQGKLGSIMRTTGPRFRRAAMKVAQETTRRHVLPWLRTEEEEAEKEYVRVTHRFVQLANDFLKKLGEAGVPELARMPHALGEETGFRVASKFSFLDLIEIAQPASPLRWLADFALGIAGGRRIIEASAGEFLVRLIESNCTRVQSDTLNRIEESRGRLETEVRKVLREVGRISEQALAHARSTRAEGEAAVQSQLSRLDSIEREIRKLQASAPDENTPAARPA